MILLSLHDGWYVQTKSKQIPLNKYCRQVRLQRGITISKLEDIMGATRNTYSRFEQGDTTQPTNGIVALMAMGIDFYLFGSQSKE
jgi:transcriptional regulator with XRE-family HTH domain